MALVRRFRKPCYNVAQKGSELAVQRIVKARLGTRRGDVYNGLFPLGINFYMMRVERNRVGLEQFARNASRYDTLYLPKSESLRSQFERLGYVQS